MGLNVVLTMMAFTRKTRRVFFLPCHGWRSRAVCGRDMNFREGKGMVASLGTALGEPTSLHPTLCLGCLIQLFSSLNWQTLSKSHWQGSDTDRREFDPINTILMLGPHLTCFLVYPEFSLIVRMIQVNKGKWPFLFWNTALLKAAELPKSRYKHQDTFSSSVSLASEYDWETWLPVWGSYQENSPHLLSWVGRVGFFTCVRMKTYLKSKEWQQSLKKR